jgi:type IV pilus assembly protein PilY1
VYGGDYKGNVWKFTGVTSSPSILRLFTARSPTNQVQPISAAPRIARNPADNSIWVFFGTGSYINENDLGDATVQSWYGLRDDNSTIAGRLSLNDVRITDEGSIGGRLARVIEAVPPADMDGKQGWYIDLLSPDRVARGERMVEPNLFQGLTLIGATRIPNNLDVCAPGGSGFIMAIDPFTGGRRLTNFFDVNNDTSINSGDNLNGAPVSGVGFVSAPNNPTFLGRVMQVSLDDRTRETVLTDASAGQPRRVSWREIVNE